MSSDIAVDLVVIGLGPGGEHLATEAAKAGLSVVGIDERLVGGECPYYGCVPSKMVIRAANLLADARRVGTLAGAAATRRDAEDHRSDRRQRPRHPVAPHVPTRTRVAARLRRVADRLEQ